jgi:hypothetical protein
MACEIARRKSGNGTCDNGTALGNKSAAKRETRSKMDRFRLAAWVFVKKTSVCASSVQSHCALMKIVSSTRMLENDSAD